MSKYAVITICRDILRGEHTNIGIATWDDDGNYSGSKVVGSFERAKRRGDLLHDLTPEEVLQFAGSFRRIEDVTKWFESTGGAMSCLNLTAPCASTLHPATLLIQMFGKLVSEDSEK